eukprot:TRINITY_DN52256_c0_g1_i1.p1 TRINITY_DN52256_c0_g1~~TRINITY_DN52256_c0_g1_i1.p1  ORF type:complete len:332 (-),score=53.63 TRINITY_DN52256_c0_g1_i1:312-1307(-)
MAAREDCVCKPKSTDVEHGKEESDTETPLSDVSTCIASPSCEAAGVDFLSAPKRLSKNDVAKDVLQAFVELMARKEKATSKVLAREGAQQGSTEGRVDASLSTGAQFPMEIASCKAEVLLRSKLEESELQWNVLQEELEKRHANCSPGFSKEWEVLKAGFLEECQALREREARAWDCSFETFEPHRKGIAVEAQVLNEHHTLLRSDIDNSRNITERELQAKRLEHGNVRAELADAKRDVTTVVEAQASSEKRQACMPTAFAQGNAGLKSPNAEGSFWNMDIASVLHSSTSPLARMFSLAACCSDSGVNRVETESVTSSAPTKQLQPIRGCP